MSSDALTLAFVQSRLIPVVETGCHEWAFSLTSGGYGQLRFKGQHHLVHRLVYGFVKGPPGDLLVCHTCDNRKCANPEHLFLGTEKDNSDDMIDKGRQRHSGRKGSDHHGAKLDAEAVRFIRASHLSGPELATAFGVSVSAISNVRQRKSWSHVT